MKLKQIDEIGNRIYRMMNIVVAWLLLILLFLPLSIIPNIFKEVRRAIKNFDALTLIKKDYNIAKAEICRLWKL